jgi:hypothetical protein
MASVSEASPSRNTRGARNNLDAGEYSLWEFANRLRHSKEITMTRPPSKLTRKVSTLYKNRLALLEICETETPCVFKPASHLVSEIVGYNKKTNQFLVQPYNQSGEKDGKAQLESADDLWLFPPVQSAVQIRPGKNKVQVESYDIVSLRASYTKFVPKSDAKSKSIGGGKTKSGKPPRAPTTSPKKRNPPRAPTTSPKKRKPRKTRKKSKKQNLATPSPHKKALDKPTTSSVSTEEDTSLGANPFTLRSVLASFANPRS